MSSTDNQLSWTIAFSDKTTGIAAVLQCLSSGDIFGDGNCRILIATLDQKLICFDGARMTHNITIPDMPSSICVHYNTSSSSLPLVAVGAGNNILFFLNLRQFSKFTLPLPFKSPEEEAIYQHIQAQTEGYTLEQAQLELTQLKDRNVSLSTTSLSFIAADLKQTMVMNRYKELFSDITSLDCITAMASIKNNALEDDKSTRLLVGTESRCLLLLDSKDLKVDKKWEFDSPPSAIIANGYMTGSSVIVVVCRDRIVKVISNLSERPVHIHCNSLPIDVAVCGGLVYIALMSQNLQVYDITGKLQETVSFDEQIISLATVSVEERQIQLCCVATAKGNLTFLSQGKISSTYTFPEGISALYFGKVGREPNNLLSISSYGGLFMRTLSRVSQKQNEVKKEEPVSPIPIPRKSQLFLEQVEREKKDSQKMYNEWQNSLRYLSMLSANVYAQILETSVLSPIDTVHFAAKVLGMGPSFVLQVNVTNTGKEPVNFLTMIPSFNDKVYRVEPSSVSLPSLIGGYKYSAKFAVESIDREGKADVITISAVSSQYSIPLGTCSVQMPVSQFPVE